MNSASEDIKDFLVSAGVGTFGTDIFIGPIPDAPDNCIGIIDTSGMPDDLTLDSDEYFERPSVQVLTRNEGYQAGYVKARATRTALRKYNISQNSTSYLSIVARHDVLFVGRDDGGRYLFSVNYQIVRQ